MITPIISSKAFQYEIIIKIKRTVKQRWTQVASFFVQQQPTKPNFFLSKNYNVKPQQTKEVISAIPKSVAIGSIVGSSR